MQGNNLIVVCRRANAAVPQEKETVFGLLNLVGGGIAGGGTGI